MAKIYETKQDIDRERLTGEIYDARHAKDTALSLGLSSGALSMVNISLAEANKELKEIHKKGPSGGLDRFFAYAFAALTGLEIVRWFTGNNKQKRAEQDLKVLGPQQIVAPQGVNELPAPLAGDAVYKMAGHVERLNAARDAEPVQPLIK